MQGTYEDLSMLTSLSDEVIHTPIPTHIQPGAAAPTTAPQPLSQITMPEKLPVAKNEHGHNSNDDNDDSQREKEQQHQWNLDQDYLYDPEKIVIETFVISPEIQNVDDFLIGPLQHNMQNAMYLKLIPEMTDTTCTLNGRSIKIEGSPSNVREAYQKFAVIHRTYVSR